MAAPVKTSATALFHAPHQAGKETASIMEAAGSGMPTDAILHDLKNLLTPILSLVELVMLELPREDAHQSNLALACQATRQAKSLIDRASLPRQDPSAFFRKTDLSRFLLSLLPLFRETLPPTIKLRDNITPVPLMPVDCDRLYQAISNLVINAVEAIGERQGEIVIGLSVLETAPAPQARVTVADNGPGISDDTGKHIFEASFSTKRSVGGQGLGLAIVRSVAEAHGGTVDVESELGVGACFALNLPLPKSA